MPDPRLGPAMVRRMWCMSYLCQKAVATQIGTTLFGVECLYSNTNTLSYDKYTGNNSSCD